MNNLLLNIMMIIYRIIEYTDGEKGLHIISYRTAEKVKLSILLYIGRQEDVQSLKDRILNDINEITSCNKISKSQANYKKDTLL